MRWPVADSIWAPGCLGTCPLAWSMACSCFDFLRFLPVIWDKVAGCFGDTPLTQSRSRESSPVVPLERVSDCLGLGPVASLNQSLWTGRCPIMINLGRVGCPKLWWGSVFCH